MVLRIVAVHTESRSAKCISCKSLHRAKEEVSSTNNISRTGIKAELLSLFRIRDPTAKVLQHSWNLLQRNARDVSRAGTYRPLFSDPGGLSNLLSYAALFSATGIYRSCFQRACCGVHRSLETLRRLKKIVEHSGQIKVVGIRMTLQSSPVKLRPAAVILLPCLFRVVGTTPAVRGGDESPVRMRELISADRHSRPLGIQFLLFRPGYFDESYLTHCGVFSERCSLQMQLTSSVRLSYCQCKPCCTLSNRDKKTPDMTTTFVVTTEFLGYVVHQYDLKQNGATPVNIQTGH